MNKTTRTFVGAMVAHLLFVGILGAADPPKPESTAPRTGPEPVIRTVRLSHTDAGVVAHALKNFGDLPVQVEPIGNDRLLVRGTEEVVRNVVDKYIPTIDVPGRNASSSAVFLPVRHYPIGELTHLLNTVAPHTKIGLDELNRLLVVNANEPSVSAIRELLQQVDRPLRSATLQFYFLKAERATSATPRGGELPAALQPIGKTLTENGFGQSSLLAPIIVAAQEGEEFESHSVLRTEGDTKGSDVLAIGIKGTVHVQPGAEVVLLRVEARLAGIVEAGQADYGPTFELETSLTARAGGFVILAAAPSSLSPQGAVALAVRVTID